MKNEPEIRVGIITDGVPIYAEREGCIYVDNLLIGYGFHWQKKINARMCGRIELLTHAQPPVYAMNILPVEDYLLSVIGSEMNPLAPLEFLKAHAVISRSWVLRKLNGTALESGGRIHTDNMVTDWEESDSHVGFDVCSDDHCQRYQGLPSAGYETARDAILATRGEVLVDSRGDVADARFSKCCGGTTERFSSCWADMDYDYLPVRYDAWCDLSDMSSEEKNAFLSSVLKEYDRSIPDFYDWTAEVSKTALAERLKEAYGVDIGMPVALEPVRRGGSGRIVTLKIKGTGGDFIIGKELAIRRLLSDSCLYSSWFEANDDGDRFILNGRGWGHGVGLCQIGAARMAFEGKNYKEILNFYYPDTVISKQYD